LLRLSSEYRQEAVGLAELITSRKNQLIAHLRKLGVSRSYRIDCGEYVCEGMKLFEEALKWGAEIKTLLYCAKEPEYPETVRAFMAPESVLESVSSMDSVPDLIFSCALPVQNDYLAAGRYIILEDLQDPGNVGTIIRTASAFTIDSVILIGDTADAFSPKAVRASMGAVFRQRILTLDLPELLELLGSAAVPLYATGFGADYTGLCETEFSGSAAIAIGNEGHGLSEKLISACDKKITIPMSAKCESLNAAAAAAVIMWELYRRK
jgi:RNA methyltransferase, TrmH family